MRGTAIQPPDPVLRTPVTSDELDLYANLSHSFGKVDAWVGYTAYLYPEGGGRTGGDSTNEVGTGIGGSVGPVDLALGVYYDFDVDGWYFDLTAGHTHEINDMISIQVAAGISYGIDYWTFGNDWNHIMLMAGLPIKLTDRATLTPYVAANFALDAIDRTKTTKSTAALACRLTSKLIS